MRCRKATNFGDRIALLDISADETALQAFCRDANLAGPGGWEDYTVTAGADEQDRRRTG